MLLLKKSYDKCIEIFKLNYKKDYIGLFILNHNKMKHYCAFFSFIKIIDNIINSNIPYIQKKKKLFDLERIFFLFYKNYKRDKDNAIFLTEYVSKNYKDFFNIHLALFDTFDKFEFGEHNIISIFKIKRMDLDTYIYNTFNNLEVFLSEFGEVYAEFIYLLFKNDNESLDVYDYIYTLGKSIQFNYILFNIKNDYEKDPIKVYLPVDEQEECLCDIERELPMIINSEKENVNFKKLINYQITRLDKFYNYSQVGINKINKKYSNVIESYVKCYCEQNKKIVNEEFNILNEEYNFSYYQFFKNLDWYNIFIIIFNYIYFFI